ncbi:MAG: ArsR family transcriptional regulator [Thermoplasmata archaeon HGW-Thermoplasmata-1]|nr:MAG: ArsR family transcriptional regulator [Thermoplasmata archaeon HGW-Thermoplasmata-1]
MKMTMNTEKLLKCLADPNRQRIIKEIAGGKPCVNCIAQATGMEQSLVSHHLAKLKCCCIVTPRQEGKNVFYSLVSPKIVALLEMAAEAASEISRACDEGACEKGEC